MIETYIAQPHVDRLTIENNILKFDMFLRDNTITTFIEPLHDRHPAESKRYHATIEEWDIFINELDRVRRSKQVKAHEEYLRNEISNSTGVHKNSEN